MIILSGDIGGTQTRLLLSEFNKDGRKSLHKESYPSNRYPDLMDILEKFLRVNNITKTDVAAAAFAVAGPVKNGKAKFTNLPWLLKTELLKKGLELDNVYIINDFQGIGYGLDLLDAQDVYVLQKGKKKKGLVRAYLGAGTGLGVGFTIYKNNSWESYPTEGGHIDFAPIKDDQMELLRYTRKRYHRVSFERLLSGQGLVNIYRFVRDNRLFNEKENPYLRFALINSKDPAAVISEYGLSGKDIMALRALDIFIGIYGSIAGNLALTFLPYGGLYIVGGIAPKILTRILNTKSFIEAYMDKGRMSGLLRDIPLYIVTNTDVGLQGTAVYAKKQIE